MAAERGLASPAWPGMIVREREPENLEFPFSTLDTTLPKTVHVVAAG